MNYPFSTVCALLGVVSMHLVFQNLPEGNRIIKSPKGCTGVQINIVVAWLHLLMSYAQGINWTCLCWGWRQVKKKTKLLTEGIKTHQNMTITPQSVLICPVKRTGICCCSQERVVKALRALIRLIGPKQSHLWPPATPVRPGALFKQSSGSLLCV